MSDLLNIKLKAIMGESMKKILTKLMFPFKNNFILYNFSNHAENKKVNIDFWGEAPNIGDSISRLIVEYMLSKKNILPDVPVSSRRHLYAVGSVLTAGIQDCTVWGSGVLNSKLAYRLEHRKLDVRSVRGPLTRVVLNDYGYECPEIYGDPAIFMPEIYMPSNVEKNGKVGLIIHKDYKLDEREGLEKFINIDIKTDDYKKFVNELTSVDKVISSSLHGVILAEVYGIPTVLLKPQVDLFKYYDYYYSTNRTSFPIAESVEDAINLNCPPIPDFTEMKSKVEMAFPYDIFQN